MMRERGGGAGDEDGANAPISLLEEERGDDDSYLFLEERVRCFFPLCESTFSSLGFSDEKKQEERKERVKFSLLSLCARACVKTARLCVCVCV